ncbi:hypothetical protein [Flavobacterium psychrophilum]|uniref:hypothetical protein n=1 Tax=Flavobacterium psychrophilum TaxID=96345 RepID=UPI000F513BD5|nr:hypothetical protein [Flavobacterium psychrophilum]
MAKIISEYSKDEIHFFELYQFGISKWKKIESSFSEKNINKSGPLIIRQEIVNYTLKMENKKLELEKLQNEIDLEIAKIISIDERKAFPDGIINIDNYLASDLKIMWILKEPNSSEELNWRDEIGNLKTETGTKYGWSGTFNPIIYVSYGILNNQNWNQIPYTNDNPEIIEVLKSIAFVNVKKTPGESVSFDNEIHEYHSNNKEILIKQIKYYQPNVIICGNTFQYIGVDVKEIFKELEFEYDENSKMSKHHNTEIIIIDAFHPNARKNKEIYCDYIINSVNEWKKEYRN